MHFAQERFFTVYWCSSNIANEATHLFENMNTAQFESYPLYPPPADMNLNIKLPYIEASS